MFKRKVVLVNKMCMRLGFPLLLKVCLELECCRNQIHCGTESIKSRSSSYMETSVPVIFADSKLTEISNNLRNNIKTSSKVRLILKVLRVWLKN